MESVIACETDRLRKGLHERGVKFETHDGRAVKNTYWKNYYGVKYCYSECLYDDGEHSGYLDIVTPTLHDMDAESVISATIVPGRCEASIAEESNGDFTIVCQHCGFREYYSEAPQPNYCSRCGYGLEITRD